MTTEKESFKKGARAKAMDYLARRDHSEKELAEKLSKHFEAHEIEDALSEMRQRGWILPPEELAEKAAKSLHQRQKGHLYIQHFLREKGLPEVAKDSDLELEKALNLCQNRLKDPSDIRRLSSLLKNRGFDTETITRVIDEVRRNTPSFY